MATAAELWAAAAASALADEDEEGEAGAEVEIAAEDDVEMVVEDAEPEAGAEGMTAEEEAEARRLLQAELGEVASAQEEVQVEAEEPAVEEAEVVELEDEPEAAPPQPPPQPTRPAPPKPPQPPKPAQPKPQQPAPEAPGKAFGKGGPAAWKGQQPVKGKGKGKGAPEGKGRSETFFGLVHQVGEKTGNMLVKSWKVSERYGQEAMIPKLANPANAALGDKVSFEILERDDGARPLAVNVQVRGHVDLAAQASGPPNEIRRQVLYYLSDDNLRTDKFFQGVIASSEGGWIPMTTILGCPRMKQMKATIENVFAAVRDATEVEIREAPAGEEAIRRTSPAPPLDTSNARDWGGGMPKGKGKGKFEAKGQAKGKFEPRAEAKGFAGKGAAAPVVEAPVGEAKGQAKGAAVPAAAAAEPVAVEEVAAEEAMVEEVVVASPPAAASASPVGGAVCEDVYYAGKVKSQMRMEPRKLFISCEEITTAFGRDAYFLPSQKPQAVEVGSLVVFSVPADSEVGFSPHANFVAQLAPLGSLGRAEAESSPASNGASKGPGVQKTIVKKVGPVAGR